MKNLLLVFAFPLLCACTSQPNAVEKFNLRKPIELSGLAKLRMGSISTSDARAMFGLPDQIVQHSRNEEIWMYERHNMNLWVNTGNQRVQTATWTPSSSDPLRNQDQAIAYFRDRSLTPRPVGWVSHPHYSYESHENIYESRDHSISIVVNTKSHTVSSISFFPPRAEK